MFAVWRWSNVHVGVQDIRVRALVQLLSSSVAGSVRTFHQTKVPGQDGPFGINKVIKYELEARTPIRSQKPVVGCTVMFQNNRSQFHRFNVGFGLAGKGEWIFNIRILCAVYPTWRLDCIVREFLGKFTLNKGSRMDVYVIIMKSWSHFKSSF